MSHLAGWNRHSVRAAAVAVLTTVLLAPAALASPITFVSPLSPEALGATGSGLVTVVFDGDANQLRIEADWTGLSGTTTVAHIHCCTLAPGTGTVGVAVTPGTLPGFPVGTSAGTYVSPVLDLSDPSRYTASFLNNFGGGTTTGAEAALLAGMLNGSAYFNVHTSTFPGGEIRGFLSPVPEPTTMMLLGGAVALGVLRRRRVRG